MMVPGIRAWLHTPHQDMYGVWSWYDQTAAPIYYKSTVEALTITYLAVRRIATQPDNCWLFLFQTRPRKRSAERHRPDDLRH